jgi:cytochrome c553
VTISADGIAAVGVILLAIATQAGWVGQSAVAAEAPPVAPASSVVAGGGVTLHSVSVKLPRSDGTFPGGAGADAINNDCLICHSAGMVLDQAKLSRAQWQDEVNKMRDFFKAPFPAEDVPAIVDYLANLKDVMSQSAGRQPDARHGAVIAAQGTPSGAPACAQCHAFSGGSDGSGAFPRIAGQSAYYLRKQLRDFTSDVRANAIMSPIAKALSADDIADVSAYYAGVNAPFLPLAKAEPALIQRGEQLAKVGSAAKDVQACDNCHGPIPYLAGQYARYIAFELQMWQRGYRKSSPEVMFMIATKLDDQDIAALAAYYQQVPASDQTTASK